MNLGSLGFPEFKLQEVELPPDELVVCKKVGGKVTGNVYIWNTFALRHMPDAWAACFYTEDWRFSKLLKGTKSSQFYLHKFDYIIQPDFSVYYDQPLIDQWWRTWMGKQIADVWQRNGHKIIPSLVLGSTGNYDAAVYGIPKGQVFAVQLQANDANPAQDEVDAATIARAVADIAPPYILAYTTKDRLDRLHLPQLPIQIIHTNISKLRQL
jgi:hypothetical protein